MLVAGLVVLKGTPSVAPIDPRELSNGCRYSPRGIPECGAYVGAAVGGNDDPAERERALGYGLGLRRTYWRADQTASAVETARDDLARGRLPWISFKLGVDWGSAASGGADEWTRSLAARLAELPGPVWVALHHEPEGDGPIDQWRAMQERLGPILRDGARNVAFTVILTGWNQINKPEEFSLDRVWPDTGVDVAGFDVYQFYGAERGGSTVSELTDLSAVYFEPFSRWAQKQGVAWAVAETGITDLAARTHPDLMESSYADLVAAGGIALTYFDSSLNSTANWTLDSGAKSAQFAALLSRAPRLPELD